MHASKLIILFLIISFFYACSEKKEKIYRPVSVVNHPVWSINKTIYEVNIRQYTPEGTFKAFQKHLPALKDLGVGIIWLMPIHPIGKEKRKGSLGSYYSVRDFMAINPDFGSKEEFADLVKAIHEAGMFVIIDWVANHSAWDNPLTKSNPEFYTKDKNGNFALPDPNWTDVIDFNYDNLDMRNYMLKAMKYWVTEFDIDGYRCDMADLVPTDFWDQTRRDLDAIKQVFMLAESETAFLHNRAFDMTYDWKMFHTLNKIAKGKSNSTQIDSVLLASERLFPKSAFRMRFTTNHDENSWNGTVAKRLGDAAKVSAVLTATLPGKPLLYSGQEAGLDRPLKFFDKDQIDWKESTFREFYSRLFNLYQNNPALHLGNMVKIDAEDDKDVFAFARIADPHKVVVVLNFSDQQKEIELDSGLLGGSYKELFSGVNVVFENSEDFELEPWAYRVFVGEQVVAKN
ncbi:MAG: alpha-amylase [Calditrichaeota bacterium]|nr:MAG: alpha-amylase [Calditrichota bacterium]MBL1206525.1 alpha-amylase [Calditrichota bacterium]NOG46352.1 alpha-amylase [Calditrichota bacterium]